MGRAYFKTYDVAQKFMYKYCSGRSPVTQPTPGGYKVTWYW